MQKQHVIFLLCSAQGALRSGSGYPFPKNGESVEAKGRPAVSQQHLREGEDGGFNELNMRSYPTKTENFTKHEDDLQYPLLLDSPQRFGVNNKTDEF